MLCDERPFPHDGRNIPLLFNYSVQKKQFILLGGIGKTRKGRTDILYRYLLPKAEKIAVRDRDSLAIAKKWNPENTLLHQDFAQEIILRHKEQGTRNEEKGARNEDQKKNPYILININKQSVNKENIQRIVDFCTHYPDHKKIFFPCDMNDDKYCFQAIKTYISGLEMYDRTKHSLSTSLSLFHDADG